MSNLLTRIKGLFCGGRDGRMGKSEYFSWVGMKIRVKNRSSGVENE